MQAAVVNGPRFLNKQADCGGLAGGKLAYVLVLDANALADIAATCKICAVVTRGQVLERQQLDRMLNDVQEWMARQ